jgi:hypothetical protein
MNVVKNNRQVLGMPLAAFLVLLAMLLSAASGWGLFMGQARGALPRQEAYQYFVDRATYDKDCEARDARLLRMEEKLDRILMEIRR